MPLTQMVERCCSTTNDDVSIIADEDGMELDEMFRIYSKGNPCAPVSPSARLLGDFTRTYGGCDHVTGQASFEAETHNQSRRRENAGCRRTEFFAGE
jgi:hypothetical protein